MRKRPYHWEPSAFDSEILGVNAAKILDVQGNTPKIARTNVKALVEELEEVGVQYAVYRIPAAEYTTIQCLEENGFVVVDGLITLRASVHGNGALDSGLIVKAVPKDLPQLSLLAGSVFRGVSRYYHDPSIPRRTADSVYKQWIKNSLAGIAANSVFVWKEHGKILGFITLQKKENHGDIPLIGVSPLARGRGIGKQLIRAALSQCKEWGVAEITVATQVANVPALRLYQSCGFMVTASHLTLRWRSGK